MAGGRPTKYNPEMCETVKELAREGASKAEIAYDLGIAWSTMALWEQQHKEFSDAVKEAVQISQGWWEKNGRLSTFKSEGFNATAYIFNMTNRFGNDWKHKSEQTSTIEASDSLTALLSGLTKSVFPKADE